MILRYSVVFAVPRKEFVMKQKTTKIIAALLIVLLVAGLVYDVVKNAASVRSIVIAVYVIVLSLIALFYMHRGCKKDVATWFKIYSIGFMILQAMILLKLIITGKHLPCIISGLLAVVACIILTFKKNLGKMASHFLGCFLIAIDLMGLIMLCGIHGFNHENLFCFFPPVVLSFVYLACIHGKYIDKDERGTI